MKVKPNVCCYIMNCFLVLTGSVSTIVLTVLAGVGVAAVVVVVMVVKKILNKYGRSKVSTGMSMCHFLQSVFNAM